MIKHHPARIEHLEDRIAPAAVTTGGAGLATDHHLDTGHFSKSIVPVNPPMLVNSTTATFTDVDGDKVTVLFSKPILTSANLQNILVTTTSGAGLQLEEIDLTGVASAAKATNITVSAVPTATAGDGQVNVGEILATGIDLGKVAVHGDLGLILAGADSGAGDVALKGLTVNSLGVFGSSTGAIATTSGPQVFDESDLAGSVGPIVIHGNATNIRLDLLSNLGAIPAYSYSNITIGGSLTATGNSHSELYTDIGSFGAVKIGGSMNASSIHNGGSGKIASITIGGDITGSGSEFYTDGGPIGAIKVGGSILDSMLIGDSPIASLTVGGSVSGIDLYSGASGKIGPVKIGGDLNGGFIGDGPITSVSIGGSATGLNINSNTGPIGPVKIGGSLTGSSSIESLVGSIASISVNGELNADIRSQTGIGSIKVTGDVDDSKILVGLGSANALYTKSVRLGSLSVGGDWNASSVAVGVINYGSDDLPGGTGTAADNVNFGNSFDNLFTATGSTAVVGAITIGGEVLGTPSINGDSFAFAAGKISSFKSGGVAISVKSLATAGPRPLGLSGDVFLEDVLAAKQM